MLPLTVIAAAAVSSTGTNCDIGQLSNFGALALAEKLEKKEGLTVYRQTAKEEIGDCLGEMLGWSNTNKERIYKYSAECFC